MVHCDGCLLAGLQIEQEGIIVAVPRIVVDDLVGVQPRCILVDTIGEQAPDPYIVLVDIDVRVATTIISPNDVFTEDVRVRLSVGLGHDGRLGVGAIDGRAVDVVVPVLGGLVHDVRPVYRRVVLTARVSGQLGLGKGVDVHHIDVPVAVPGILVDRVAPVDVRHLLGSSVRC